MRIFRQSFDVNRLTLYTGIIDFTALQPHEAPIPPATPTTAPNNEVSHDPHRKTVEEPFLSAKLIRHLPLLLLMGHLVVLLPALAQLHGPQRRRSGHHLLHQLTRHPCAHVLLRPDPRQSGPQTASRARNLHDRGARRALRAVHLRAAHAHQHDGRRNDRLHRAVRWVHGRLFAHRGRHRTVQPQVQLRIRPVARLGLLRLRDRGARRRHRIQHQPDDQLLARLGVRRRHAHRVPHVVPGRPARGAQGGIGTGRGAHQPLTQRDGQGAAHAGPVGAHRVHAAHQHVLHRVDQQMFPTYYASLFPTEATGNTVYGILNSVQVSANRP